MLPGINTAIGVIAKIIDTLWPSKKAALFDKLKALEFEYHNALINKQDTKAAEIRKKMADLRRKAGFSEGEL